MLLPCRGKGTKRAPSCSSAKVLRIAACLDGSLDKAFKTFLSAFLELEVSKVAKLVHDGLEIYFGYLLMKYSFSTAHLTFLEGSLAHYLITLFSTFS